MNTSSLGTGAAVISTLLIALVACGGAAPTGTPTASTASTASTSASGRAPEQSAATSPSMRTFELTLPDGWIGVDVAPAGLLELSAKLKDTWPAVSDGLTKVAAGGPAPFGPGTTFLAYDLAPNDLAVYPTGFNIRESPPANVGCSALDLQAGFKSSGAADVSIDFLDLGVGRVARVSGRIGGGPVDLLGETFAVTEDGRGYQLYFETTWDQREKFDPIFEGIVGSMRVIAPLPLPDAPFSDYPHEAPDFEALMPQTALGRPLCVWSLHGGSIWPVVGTETQTFEESILRDLGLDETALTYAFAGRANHTDPPYFVEGYRYAGANPDKILREFDGWSGDTRREGDHLAFVFAGKDDPGHAEGLDYFVPIGDSIYHIKAGDEAWFKDVIGRLP